MFLSGQSFSDEVLSPNGKLKAAEVVYTKINEVDMLNLNRWIRKSREIRWDYKNLVKNKGVLAKIN